MSEPPSQAPTFDERRLLTHHDAKMPERAEMILDLDFRGTVLDAGGGLGQFAELIAERTGAPVLCVDEQVFDARSDHGLINYLRGDIHHLPLRDASVNGVWCANVLMYSTSPVNALREFRRVLRQHGLVAIKEEDSALDLILSWDPDLDLEVRTAWHNALRQQAVDGDGYLGRRVANLVHKAGFVDVQSRTYVIKRSFPFTGQFSAYLRNAFLAYQHVYQRLLSTPSFNALTAALDPHEPNSFLNSPFSQVLCLESVVSARVTPGPTSSNQVDR